MNPFDKSVTCDKCGASFIIDDSRFASITEGDLEVQYFSCPSCGAKYLSFASDSKMRDLIQQRRAVQTKIQAARAKMFKAQVIKKYMREYEKIKKKQEKLLPDLRARGWKVLNGK